MYGLCFVSSKHVCRSQIITLGVDLYISKILLFIEMSPRLVELPISGESPISAPISTCTHVDNRHVLYLSFMCVQMIQIQVLTLYP